MCRRTQEPNPSQGGHQTNQSGKQPQTEDGHSGGWCGDLSSSSPPHGLEDSPRVCQLNRLISRKISLPCQWRECSVLSTAGERGLSSSCMLQGTTHSSQGKWNSTEPGCDLPTATQLTWLVRGRGEAEPRTPTLLPASILSPALACPCVTICSYSNWDSF